MALIDLTHAYVIRVAGACHVTIRLGCLRSAVVGDVCNISTPCRSLYVSEAKRNYNAIRTAFLSPLEAGSGVAVLFASSETGVDRVGRRVGDLVWEHAGVGGVGRFAKKSAGEKWL
jgi:hypothetical protein